MAGSGGLIKPLVGLWGGYHDPLVGAYTPFTKIGVQNPVSGAQDDWPPHIDWERLQQYEHYTALIENRPWDVFPDLHLTDTTERLLAIAVALPELICNVWPDSVWNDPPDIEWETDTTEATWAAVWDDNGMADTAWESVLGAAFRGQSILQVRRDESGRHEQGTRIEEIEPGIYFPIVSNRETERVYLAWEEDRDPYSRRPDVWQVREHHRLDGDDYVIEYDERKKGDEGWRESRPDERVARLGVLPFVELHGARWAGRYWGISELARIDSLINEVDSRLSAISSILDYHGDPLLQVPASAMPGGILTKNVDRVLGIRNPTEKDIAKYITYEAMGSTQFEMLRQAVEYTFLTCEVPPTYFGFVEGSAMSGTALRLRLQNYLKKAGRWQRREDGRLHRLAWVVGAVEGISPEARRIRNISFGSPLPADDEQEARIEASLHAEGLTSRALSIRRLRRVEPEDLDAEVAAIEAEQSAAGAIPVPSAPPPGLGAATSEPPTAGAIAGNGAGL